MEDIQRMLLMTFRTVALAAPWAWSSWATTSPGDVPWAPSIRLSQSRTGVIDGSWSRSRCTSWTAKAPTSGVSSRARTISPTSSAGAIAEAQQPVRQHVGAGARVAGADHLLRQPSQVLHQRHAQVDGHGPELADAERLDALIGPHEARERLELEAAVGMGDIGPRQPIRARGAGEMARGDLRQRLVVAAREVVPDLPELLVDDVEVVEEPLLGERDLALRADRLDDVVIPGEENAPVLADPGKEIPPLAGLSLVLLGRGQALCVLLEALDAEELGADGLLRDPVGIQAHGEGGLRERRKARYLRSSSSSSAVRSSIAKAANRFRRPRPCRRTAAGSRPSPSTPRTARRRRPRGCGARWAKACGSSPSRAGSDRRSRPPGPWPLRPAGARAPSPRADRRAGCRARWAVPPGGSACSCERGELLRVVMRRSIALLRNPSSVPRRISTGARSAEGGFASRGALR